MNNKNSLPKVHVNAEKSTRNFKKYKNHIVVILNTITRITYEEIVDFKLYEYTYIRRHFPRNLKNHHIAKLPVTYTPPILYEWV